MFALFFSLYYSMFVGNWTMFDLTAVTNKTQNVLLKIIMILTNIFNNTSSNINNQTFSSEDILGVTALVLALITSIGIVVMAVKGIKRIFSVFFYGVR